MAERYKEVLSCLVGYLELLYKTREKHITICWTTLWLSAETPLNGSKQQLCKGHLFEQWYKVQVSTTHVGSGSSQTYTTIAGSIERVTKIYFIIIFLLFAKDAEQWKN